MQPSLSIDQSEEKRQGVLNCRVRLRIGTMGARDTLCFATLLENSPWRHTGNYLATVAAVDAKVRIGSKNDGIGEYFGHAHEASISETHGNVCVFLQELQYRLEVVVQIESGDENPTAKQCAESRHSACAQKMEGLRQNSFAGAPGRRVARRLHYRPSVMGVATAEQRHEKAGVNEQVSGHSPWLSSSASCVRSGQQASHRPSR